jgi:prepilin-type N-terminal cleavage/methylation domain-containing protein
MSRDEAGFTLIELLVAMTAAALLLASLSWSVSRLGKQLAAPAGSDDSAEVAALRPVLVGLLGSAITESGDDLEIDRRSARFVTAAPAAMGGTGHATVRLQVSGPTGNRHLVGAISTNEDGTAERKFRSVHGWKDIIFSAVGEQDEPAALRIDFLETERRDSIVAALKVNVRGDCEFDPISMACRP